MKDNNNNKEMKNICIGCLYDLSILAKNLGYDKEIWVEEAINEINLLDNNFYLVPLKKIKEIVQILSDRSCDLEVKLSELFNDIRYGLHDVQAPIRSIKFFSDMLINNSLSKQESLDLLERINRSSIIVTDMLKDIKDMMSLGKNVYVSNMEIIDFPSIIQDIELNLLHSLIQEKSAEIIVEKGNMPKIISNKLRWTRVFQNLVSNAIVYNISSQPKIRIWFEEDKIFIQDNGIGIPKQKWEVVFEMFTRLSDRKEMADGTGTGLFMCRKFLNIDGFNIRISESDNNGTLFLIFKNS